MESITRPAPHSPPLPVRRRRRRGPPEATPSDNMLGAEDFNIWQVGTERLVCRLLAFHY